MFRKLTLIATIAAVTLTTGAQAQSTAAPPQGKPVARADVPVEARMSMHVGAMVLEDLKQFVTDDKKLGAMYLQMLLLAKQEAIGASCAAYELDQPRMVASMMRTMRPLTEGVEPDVAQSHLQRALRQYNTLLGGELAQFAYNPDNYCTAAKELYAQLGEDEQGKGLLVLKPTA